MSKLKNSLMWSAIDRFSVIFIQIIIEIILARIIDPKNYGLIGLAAIFLVFGNVLLDSGFSKALIQKQNRTDRDYATMFYLNLMIGIIVYLIIFFSADYVGIYFNQPTLGTVIKVLSLNLLITGFSLIQRTQLLIELNFKRLAKISFVSVVFSGVISVLMAFNGFGVWALVAQSVLVNLSTLLLFYFSNPILPKLSHFSKKSFNHMFKFGGNLTLSSLLQAIYQNSFTFFIGKNFSTATLGLYNKSNQFTLMPISVLTNIINRVTYPEFSTIQNNDELLARSHLKFIKYFTYIVFPLFIGFASISKDFIQVFLGSKWIEADQIIQILAISYIFYPFTVMNMTVFQVKDKTRLFFQIDLITKIISFIILFLLVPFGIIWVCMAIFFSQISQFFISTFFSNKLLSIDNFNYFKIITLNLIYFFLVYLVVIFFNDFINISFFRILASVAIFLFFTFALLCFKEKELIKKILSKFLKLKK